MSIRMLMPYLIEDHSMNATSTLDALRDWPVEDQLALVFRMWDQIVDSGWQPVPIQPSNSPS